MNVVHFCPYCGDEDLWPQPGRRLAMSGVHSHLHRPHRQTRGAQT